MSQLSRFALLLLVLQCALSDSGPQQVHLAVAGTGMTISWVTDQDVSSYCEITRADAPDVTPTSIIEGPGHRLFRELYFHSITFADLYPNTEYVYSCGDPEYGMTSETTFVTALAPGDSTPFNVLIVGDIGTCGYGKETTDALVTDFDNYDFIWHMGDIGYVDDFFLYPDVPACQSFATYEGIMNEYMDRIEPVASRKPYMVAVGNHDEMCQQYNDSSCPENERNYTAYNNIFDMPHQLSNATNNMWYSFDYGLVHFISIDTETDFPNSPIDPTIYGHDSVPGGPFGDQLGWLEADLKAASENRENVPWIFVGGHRPLYTSGPSTCDACRAAFEPLFQEYNVDIYFCGHEHLYERMFQISDSEVIGNYENIEHTAYILVGSGGNLKGHSEMLELQDFTAMVNRGEFGYGILSVLNETHLEWTFKKSHNFVVADGARISRHPDRGMQKGSSPVDTTVRPVPAPQIPDITEESESVENHSSDIWPELPPDESP